MIELGFNNITVMPNRQMVKLASDVSAVCFESKSVWNDSIQYLDFGGFEVLKMNDAGINRDVKEVIGTVNLVASAFSQNASGYPITWRHLSDEENLQLVRAPNEG